VKWKNTTPHALHDVEVECVIEGVMLDGKTVVPHLGYFRSYDNTVIWTPQTKELFRVIEPGEEGKINFVFHTTEFENRTSLENPTMNFSFNVRARRISDNIPVPETLTQQASKKISFDTDAVLDVFPVYSIGEFTNTGPYPPKVDTETTYTVFMRVSNTMNDMNSAVVRGELPLYVEWMNEYEPKNEQVSFNTVTREVMWSIGDLPRATGYESPVRELQIQVSAIPSIKQENKHYRLMSNIVFKGVDSFTGNMIERNVSYIESELKRDPFYKNLRETRVTQ